jgi:uncharacterized protein
LEIAMRRFALDLAARYPVAAYFLAAFALTWAVWVPRALVDQGVLDWDWPLLLGRAWTYGPALAAVAVTTALAGTHGLRRLGAAMIRWRVGWRWFALIMAAPFAVSWSATLLHALLTGQAATWPVQQPADLLVFPLLILILALTDGLGEEVGWRGFALPRLQEWLRPIAASLVLGVVWAAWHLPLVWTHGAALESRSFLLLLLQLLPTAILFTWVFNHTRGSVLLAILLHATQNLAGPVIPPPGDGLLTPYLLSVVLKWALALSVLGADPSFRARSPSRGEAGLAAAAAT